MTISRSDDTAAEMGADMEETTREERAAMLSERSFAREDDDLAEQVPFTRKMKVNE